MTTSVLDHAATPGAHQERSSLGSRHDEVDAADASRLPCRSNDPELWFAESPTDVEHAKALCRERPVRQICLAGAIDRGEPWGVWGGQLFLAGAVVPRKRPHGRPRKDAHSMY